jgi:stage IV sporulation protein FB
MSFSFLGYPAQIQMNFWFLAAVLSGAFSAKTSTDWQEALVWIVVAVFSILIHEVGHASIMRHFGDDAVRIELNGMGGAAIPTRRFTRGQDFLLTLAGPLASVSLGLIGWLVMKVLPPQGDLAKMVFDEWLWINFGWTVLNMLPVLPMDGGRLLLCALGPNHVKTAFILSLMASIALLLFAALSAQLWMSIVAALFVWQGWTRLKQADLIAPHLWIAPPPVPHA